MAEPDVDEVIRQIKNLQFLYDNNSKLIGKLLGQIITLEKEIAELKRKLLEAN